MGYDPSGTATRCGHNSNFYSTFKMAKSKSGGTRSMIRGRVGSDVYSVGRDAKGKKQQIVRSLAETVSNPRTQSQMRGRMIMATIAQALAVLRPIVDHSFDNVTGSRANLAEFTSRNYALIKADIAANPNSGNKFGLVLYNERGAKRGQFIIADGQANVPNALTLTKDSGLLTITLAADDLTIGGLKSVLGMTSEEYFTLVGLDANGQALYERFRINPSMSASTVISADNLANVFATEGNAVAAVTLSGNTISILLEAVATCCAVIVSKKANGKYIHNEAVLGGGTNFENTANVALPTYPVGQQDYLNGGDIFGLNEAFVQSTESNPQPEQPGSETPSSISSLTVNGSAMTSGSTKQVQAGDVAIVAQIAAGTVAGTYGLYVVSGTQPQVGASVAAGDITAVAGSSVSKTFTMEDQGATRYIGLTKDGSVIQRWGAIAFASGGGDDLTND